MVKTVRVTELPATEQQASTPQQQLGPPINSTNLCMRPMVAAFVLCRQQQLTHGVRRKRAILGASKRFAWHGPPQRA